MLNIFKTKNKEKQFFAIYFNDNWDQKGSDLFLDLIHSFICQLKIEEESWFFLYSAIVTYTIDKISRLQIGKCCFN